MKLLICTQAIDVEDSDLGFLVRWIEEFAKNCERITVICLREGKHELPVNVKVYEIGKAESRRQKAVRFVSLAWKLRKEYDAVFVHMNPEYVVLGGLFWRLWRKRIALWYTHKSVNFNLRLATLLSNVIFTASKESFRLKSSKIQVVGHGIDTDFFSPDASVARGGWLLSVGRLMRSKRHDLAIRIAVEEGKELRIAGDGPERKHLEELARKLGVRVQFLGGLTQARLRDEYRKPASLIHTSETGSLDKVVLEALACGLPVHTHDPALKVLENVSASYVREHHSLQRLIPRILTFMGAPSPDPKAFYDSIMPGKLGSNYESARWQQNPLFAAQYQMMINMLHRVVEPLLQHATRVLEVGPGPGTWTVVLREVNPDAAYTLVDISQEMLARARQKLSDHTNISFVESDLVSFDPREHFDFFFSSRAIEYMPNKNATIQKIAHVLTNGGRGAIVTKMPKPLFDALRGRAERPLHSGQMHPRRLAQLLCSHGLRVMNVRIATATVPLLGMAWLNKLMYHALKGFPFVFPFTLCAESYVVTFQKI